VSNAEKTAVPISERSELPEASNPPVHVRGVDARITSGLRLRRDLTSEGYARNGNDSGGGKGLEGRGSSTLDLGNDPQSSDHLHQTASADSETKVYRHF